MPNLPQQATIVQYVTNVSQTAYTFAFYAPLPTDIQVFYQAPTAMPIPAADILTYNSQYTVAYNSDPTTGGTITLLFTPTTGYYLTINLNVSVSLNTNFANAQNFNGANLDAALDRLLLLCQQNYTFATQRNLSYVINSYLPNATPYTQLPVLPNGYIWQGTGSGVAAVQLVEDANFSTLRSQLLSETPGATGASIIGYYDPLNAVPQTLQTFLNALPTYINAVNYNQVYTDTGSTNVLVITVPNYTVYTQGDRFYISPANLNTAAPTLNINGIGANALYVSNTLAAYPLDISPSSIIEVMYNGTNWILLNPNSMLQRRTYCASVYLTAPVNITNTGAYVLIPFTGVEFDPYSMWNSGSSRFVAKVAGFYRVDANIVISIGDPATTWAGYAFVNGSISAIMLSGNYASAGTPNAGGNGSTILQLAAGDYVDFRVNQGGTVQSQVQATREGTYFEIQFLGR